MTKVTRISFLGRSILQTQKTWLASFLATYSCSSLEKTKMIGTGSQWPFISSGLSLGRPSSPILIRS